MEINKDLLKKINVLYVEDEDDVREFTARTIGNLTNTIASAENGLIGLELFTKNHNSSDDTVKFDIIITDINMPKMSGLEMCAKIRELNNNIPIVITTAHNDTDFLTNAIKLGVRGYAMKPVDLRQLIESVSIAVEPGIIKKELEEYSHKLEEKVKERTVELENVVTRLKLHTEELLYEATHDHLTGIYNRQKLTKELDNEIKRTLRYTNKFSIIMMDIDHFKGVNDTYGHDVGDEVLIAITTLATKHIRNIDTLARWGGEEFMILLPETSANNATIVANKIREDIDNSCLTSIKACHITSSFGVSEYEKDDEKSIFLKRVDTALYEAKDTGRNKVVKK